MPPSRNHSASTLHPDERANYAVSTLIIFIAAVLVATITAGVLMNTFGILEGQTEQTGDEAASELSDRLEVVTTTCNDIVEVNDEREVQRVEVIVESASGSDPIDLRNVTVQWVAGEGYVLHHEGGAGPDDDSFSLVNYADPDGNFPILTHDDDRYAFVFEPGVEFGDVGLQAGDSVALTFMSPTGSSMDSIVSVPRLIGKDSVEC